MAKRYGLDSIIGKKSTLRFPRSVNHIKTDTLSIIINSNNVISEPPFSTAITMKKGDSLDICDQLNELSYDYEGDFPIKADIMISNTGTKIDFKTPTVFSLINIIYDLDELAIENFKANLPHMNMILANISLAKINTDEEIFLSEIQKNIKTIYANISSYNCRRRKDRTVKALYSRKRKQKSNKIISQSKLHANKRDLHYFVKTKRSNQREKLPMLFDRIDEFYDLYEDWDEFFDEYLQDYYLLYSDNFFKNMNINEEFLIDNLTNYDKEILPQVYKYKEKLQEYLRTSLGNEVINMENYNMILAYHFLEEEEEEENYYGT